MPRRSLSSCAVAGAGLFLALTAAGCATNRALDRALLAGPISQTNSQEVAEGYHVQCPDVLDLAVDLRPDIRGGRHQVGPDGCIGLGPAGRMRVEGLGLTEIAARIAMAAAVPRAAVQVRVADYRSQQVYVFGQVSGLQRAVPYCGPETVRDFLQRAGGIAPGAEPTELHVVRANVADGKRPEVFAVDLKAIVMKKDEHTNVRLEPFDQVFIGETRQSSYEKVIPPLFRPLYEALVNLDRPRQANPAPPAQSPGTTPSALARQ
jgi:protein involved in polysaccharide export with SLBB domain